MLCRKIEDENNKTWNIYKKMLYNEEMLKLDTMKVINSQQPQKATLLIKMFFSYYMLTALLFCPSSS